MYLPELDGIRGLAILMVVSWHYVFCFYQGPISFVPNSDWRWLTWRCICRLLSLTFSGVDLFFVLSGFLLGGILLDRQNEPGMLRGFYLRRAARIGPLYVIFLGLVLIIRLSSLVQNPVWKDYFDSGLSIWLCAAFLQNFHFMWVNTFSPGGIFFTWSLAVEEQFYLFLPLVLWRLERRWFLSVLLSLIFLAWAFRLLFQLEGHHSLGAMVLLPCRMDALLLGVLLAWCLRQKDFQQWLVQNNEFPGRLCGGLLITSIVYSAAGLDQSNFVHTTLTLPICALFYTAFIFWTLHCAGGQKTCVLRNKLLVGFGKISFGIFLIHQWVNSFAHVFILHGCLTVGTVSQTLVSALAFAISVGFAALSWCFLEKPIIQYARGVRF